MYKKILIGLLLVCGINLFGAGKKAPVVVLETNVGKIELKMFPKAAPLAVENFVTHVKQGYYNGLIFHRVIKGFMIQGGDPTGTGRGGESIWHKEFKNEYAPNLTFDRPFLLAMANHGPNTNGSQFFITTVPTPHLNGGYTIFGKVIQGKKVVQKIENVTTSAGDRPIFDQKIIRAYIKK
ncbi:peptidylprolyl isomerase [Sulfurovum sp.]|uniref:peptidylprolyl isomerase n=1 Tax=Sulfurovum sp. TaxID=1969726 RepID=UPI0025E7E756|nr:peptidylprolyl isomerase [Sulfurovum sp.]